MEENEIVVTKRTEDYHACLKGDEGIWGCGKSIPEAIGDCVQAHPERFNLKFKIDVQQPK